MLRESININTYLNVALIIFVGLVSYIVYGIREDIIENRHTIRNNQKGMDKKFEKMDEKLDKILSVFL